MRQNPELKEAKLREVQKPETLEKRFRGKVDTEELQVLKMLLEMDPAERPDAEAILNHEYFDQIRNEKKDSPRVHTGQRVHSSTYRTNRNGYHDEDNEDSEITKRIPSYSQERQGHLKGMKAGRSESRGKDKTNSFLAASIVGNADQGMISEKKFLSTSKGFGPIRDNLSAKREGENAASILHSRKEEKEKLKTEIADPRNVFGKKKSDIKKSNSNFKMFRISI